MKLDDRQHDRVPARARRAIALLGVVQGVGFRPFVHALAGKLGLTGFVLNRQSGVLIEVEGRPEALDCFVQALENERPPLARIDELQSEPRPLQSDEYFVIPEARRRAARPWPSPGTTRAPARRRGGLNS